MCVCVCVCARARTYIVEVMFACVRVARYVRARYR